MPKSPNQKSRLLTLERIFLQETDENHPLSVKELQNRLAAADIPAERKTLYDDFEQLGKMGIEILRSGDRYYTESRLFEDAELKLLVDAVASSRFLTDKKSAGLIEKLTTLASRSGAGELNRQVILSGRVSVMNEQVLYNVDALHSAIRENVGVTFRYFDWNEKKERVPRRDGALYHVSPWALLWDDEKYYLLGYDEEKMNIYHYRVDKMEQVTPTTAKRLGEEEFRKQHVETYRTSVFGMFSGKSVRVTLRVKKSLAGVIIDRFGTDPVFYQDGEYFRTSVPVQLSSNFYGWICSFRGDVSIVDPPEVCDQLRSYLSALSSAFSENES